MCVFMAVCERAVLFDMYVVTLFKPVQAGWTDAMDIRKRSTQ